MGSGEGDAYYLKVNTAGSTNSSTPISTLTDTTYNYDWYTNTWPTTWWVNYPTTVYKYQVKCPARGCKRFNWLELDKITPCVNCGAKLKAVADTPDFTVPVNE